MTSATPLLWLHSLAQAVSYSIDKLGGKALPNGAPVILVGTHLDEIEATDDDEDPATSLLQHVADVVMSSSELNQLLNIQTIIGVSSTTGDGVEELQRALCEVAVDTPLWHTPVPASWRALSDALREAGTRRAPMLSLSDVHRFATICGVANEDIARCVRHLHYV